MALAERGHRVGERLGAVVHDELVVDELCVLGERALRRRGQLLRAYRWRQVKGPRPPLREKRACRQKASKPPSPAAYSAFRDVELDLVAELGALRRVADKLVNN